MVKPAMAAPGHPLPEASWPLVLNYNAIGPTPRLWSPRTWPQRMEGSRQMPPWGVVAQAPRACDRPQRQSSNLTVACDSSPAFWFLRCVPRVRGMRGKKASKVSPWPARWTSHVSVTPLRRVWTTWCGVQWLDLPPLSQEPVTGSRRRWVAGGGTSSWAGVDEEEEGEILSAEP